MQIISYEKKAHFNWLVAQDAEKQLKHLRQVNARNRQNLIKMHLDFEILGKDTHAFGISNTACVREHFS
jgi:hypothetical protein